MMIPLQFETDLVSYIRSQLPRLIQDKVSLTVSTDAYHLRTEVVFIAEGGRSFKTVLEREPVGSAMLACKIPDEFIAHLCAVL